MKWIAVGYELLEDMRYQLSYRFFDQRGSKLSFAETTNISRLEELAIALPKGVGIKLHLSGASVLDKMVSSDGTTDHLQLVKKALPGSNPQTFAGSLASFGRTTLVSLVRESILADVLDQFASAGLTVASVKVGLAGVASLDPLALTDLFISGKQSCQKVNDEWKLQPFSEEPRSISLDGIAFSEKDLPILAAGIAFESDLYFSFGLPNSVHAGEEETVYREKYYQLGKLALAGILILLLGNYFLFSKLNAELGELSTKSSVNALYLSELEAISTDIAEKEAMIEFTGLNKSPKLGYHADQLAACMPNSLQLDNMTLVPQISTRDQKKPMAFEFDQIHIEGETTSTTDLNEWMSSIENLADLGEVELISFARVDQSTSSFHLVVRWP